MAAPSFIAKGTYDFGDGASVSPSYMGSINAGDNLFILAFSQQEGLTIGEISTPAGWTDLGGGTISDSVPNQIGVFRVFFKLADGTESGSVTISRTGSTGVTTTFVAQIYQFRGTILASEVSMVGEVGSDSSVDFGAITITGNERTVIAMCAQNDDSGVGVPTGYTERARDQVPSAPTSELTLFTLDDVSSDGAVSAINGSSEGWGTFHLAIFNVRGRSFIVN